MLWIRGQQDALSLHINMLTDPSANKGPLPAAISPFISLL